LPLATARLRYASLRLRAPASFTTAFYRLLIASFFSLRSPRFSADASLPRTALDLYRLHTAFIPLRACRGMPLLLPRCLLCQHFYRATCCLLLPFAPRSPAPSRTCPLESRVYATFGLPAANTACLHLYLIRSRLGPCFLPYLLLDTYGSWLAFLLPPDTRALCQCLLPHLALGSACRFLGSAAGLFSGCYHAHMPFLFAVVTAVCVRRLLRMPLVAALYCLRDTLFLLNAGDYHTALRCKRLPPACCIWMLPLATV